MHEGAPEGFWHFPHSHHDRHACTDGGGVVCTYGQLDREVEALARQLRKRGSRRLGFLYSENSIAWLVAYLAALRAGHVPLLLPSDLSTEMADQLTTRYAPDWSWRPRPRAPGPDVPAATTTDLADFIAHPRTQHVAVHPALGLLLSTSGSTGSPRLVRLSYAALQANAASIAEYVGIRASDRALTTLPSHYSYGLSVINSHLAAGASIVVRDTSLLDRGFLDLVRREQVTSLAGVPTWYQMFVRTGFDKSETPSLRVLTQAGGRLDERTKRAVLAFAQRRGLQFFVMYGQTEATARISFVPPELLPENLDAIGVPIPGGTLRVDEVTSELIYQGPNVMMGYAASAEDLARGDELAGELRTGDLGIRQANGLFAVTGRLKRFVKLSGNRFGLDEIEAALTAVLGHAVAAAGRDERLLIWIEGTDADAVAQAKQILQEWYRLHHTLFRIHLIDALPQLRSGKRDYARLQQLAN